MGVDFGSNFGWFLINFELGCLIGASFAEFGHDAAGAWQMCM
jgi:hypothetical protein